MERRGPRGVSVESRRGDVQSRIQEDHRWMRYEHSVEEARWQTGRGLYDVAGRSECSELELEGLLLLCFSMFILFFHDIIPLTRSIGDDIRGLRLSITGSEMSFPGL